MSLKSKGSEVHGGFCLILAITSLLLCLSGTLMAQTTVSTGSIVGTVTDAQDAVVGGARVEITDLQTGHVIALSSNNSGAYNSGALAPGKYKVKVSAKGFSGVDIPVTVQVGTTATANAQLRIGAESTIIEVAATEIQVNTEQPTVQGVLTTQQIENLPINGRNFLDLAQLEPGVQIQDASNFDPTKGGFTGISVGSRSGRTTRIAVDGLDITDETVGTTVSNISASSIQEFSISQSSLDLSTELTSSGAVNVVTRSGTNTPHGDAFYYFRDKALAANFNGGIDPPFQRHDFGGSLGAPIVKDKLFFFINGERFKQDVGVPIVFAPPFQALSGTAAEPLREKVLLGKLDFNAPKDVRLFYRFNYDQNSVVSNGLPDYSIFSNRNNTPAHAAGADFITGRFSHSVRFGYTYFTNHIADATQSGVFNPLPEIQTRIGGFRSGPNPNAPQATFQTNKQIKYDGSWNLGAHVVRYGFGYDRIEGGGFANFFGLGPRIRSTTSPANQAIADAGPFPGGSANPLNYPVSGNLSLQLGNGQGFFTETPAFGQPGGGQLDNRIQWYVGDSWKIKPYFTLSYGLRYVRDTGRTNSDLDPIPCSALNTTIFNPAPSCTGNLLDLFGPGIGNRVRQDNNNYAPQLGFAWDLRHDGKTVIRGGAGMFYENAIFNNVLFSRPLLLQQGLFNFVADSSTGQGCASGSFTFPGGQIVTQTPGGLDIATQVCNQPIGSVASEVAALQRQYQAANIAAGTAANPQFIGETLNESVSLIDPNYRTPYSYQMNIGVQHELHAGMVLSADYIRNVNLHFLLGVDSNHVGDSRFFNQNAAVNAINLTNTGFSCPAGSAGIDCAIAAGATMEDYAGNGLSSAAALFGGPSSIVGLPADQGAAFPGINPEVGLNTMLSPVGRSTYDAMQISLRQRVANPLPYVKAANLQFSYSLSRFETAAGSQAAGEANDQDFINQALDYRDPLGSTGPASFDRTHQFSFGTTFELAKFVKFGLIGHFRSPLAQSIFIEDGGRAGEIFNTDFTGDGTTGDLVPQTKVGAFGRGVSASDIVKVRDRYNATVGGTLTPAGQKLVDVGLFTAGQLTSLGGVADTLTYAAPAEQASLGWLKNIDLRMSFPFKIGERFTIEPTAAVYNLFNFVNYDTSPTTRLQGLLNGATGTISGTTNSLTDRGAERAGQGSSLFSLGTARQLEFGMKITF